MGAFMPGTPLASTTTPGLVSTAAQTFGGLKTIKDGVQIGSVGTPITQVATYAVTLSPAQVAGDATAEQTFTVVGLSTSDTVRVAASSLGTGIGIAGARVSAADTLAITFINVTNGALTPTAGATYTVNAWRS